MYIFFSLEKETKETIHIDFISFHRVRFIEKRIEFIRPKIITFTKAKEKKRKFAFAVK